MPLDADFAAASKRVSAFSKLDNAKLLELYGLYKQATVGDVTGERPGMMDMKGRAKFDAWTSRKGMAQTLAKQRYIEIANQLPQS